MTKLAAFDFDHTLIDVNSDIYIDRVLLRDTNERYKYPPEIDSHPIWTHRMDAVFAYMHSEPHQISANELISCIREIQIDPSVIEMIRHLKESSFELIIISDANSVFIDEILKQNGLNGYFSEIYTNQARFDESGRLRVRQFNEDFGEMICRDECSVPNVCSANMCKGSILKHHLEVKMNSKNDRDRRQVIYAGDGFNDFCPGFLLKKPDDRFFVRNGFSLYRKLQLDETWRDRLNVDVIYWNTGADILEALKN